MKLRYLPQLVTLVLVCGCGTLTNPLGSFAPDFTALPEEDLRRVAANIERSIQEGDPDAEIQTVGRVSLNSPLVLQSIRTRTMLHERVAGLLSAGHAYELRNGLIQLRNTKEYKQSVPSRDRDRNASIVVSENENRWILYEGLLKINGWPSRSLDAVRSIFFEARQDTLRPGEHYESEDGGIAIKSS